MTTIEFNTHVAHLRPLLMKVGKEYKIGIIVSVNTTDLRRYLESEGIIKGFRNMF